MPWQKQMQPMSYQVNNSQDKEKNMKNKLLNKYLIPCYISAGVCFGLGTGSAYLAKKTWDDAKKLPDFEQRDKIDQDTAIKLEGIFYASAIFAVAALIMTGGFLIAGKKDAQEEINKLTSQYLQDVFKNKSSLKQYKDILQNQKKIEEIGNFVFNNLNESEQNQILENIKITRTLISKAKSEKEARAYINDAEYFVLKTIKKHERTNPDFLQNLLSLFANKHSAFIMTINDRVR